MAASALHFRREQITRGGDNKAILRGIDLTIGAGERVVLLGASGAGKTTLLNALYRSVAPDAALIPQPHGLVGPLTTRQNIALGRIDKQSLAGNFRSLCFMPKPQAAEIAELAAKLDLADQLSQRVDTLSGGQQSRVATARALYRGGPLLLADEPCAALDPERAQRVLTELTSRFETLICSMHDVDAGLQLATRVIGIANQGIAFDCLPQQLNSAQLAEFYVEQQAEPWAITQPEPLQRPCV